MKLNGREIPRQAIEHELNRLVQFYAQHGMTEDQKKYFEEADWYMNTMVHPIIREAEGGKEYREILQARLSNTIAEMKTMCREMSCLYPINSPEWLAFLTMTTDIQQGRWKGIAKLIKDNCRSFRDDYRKGLIS